MNIFDRLKIPRPLSAALVMAILAGALGGGAYGLSGPARETFLKITKNDGKINKMLTRSRSPSLKFSR